MAAEVSMTRAISASGERNPNLLRRPPRSWTRHPYGVPQDPSGEALPIGAHQSRADHSRRELNPNPLGAVGGVATTVVSSRKLPIRSVW